MNDPNSPSLHGWNQPQGFGGEMYPGLWDPFAGPPALVNPKVLPGSVNAKPGFLNNLAEWKQMIDRMGGIDGVLNTMGKVQKLFVTVQKMAPLLRIFMGKGGTAAVADKGAATRRGPRRRKGGKAGVRTRRHNGKYR